MKPELIFVQYKEDITNMYAKNSIAKIKNSLYSIEAVLI